MSEPMGIQMIDRNRRSVLLGLATLLAIPAFAGVAMAGKHDGNSTSGGGGGGNPDNHDDHDTYQPSEPGNPTNHDRRRG